MGGLLFLLLALFTLICLILLVILLLRRNFTSLRTTLKIMSIAYVLYFAVLSGVALTSRTEEVALNEPKCFDDWCVTVLSWEKTAFENNTEEYYAVTLRVENSARRADMRPDAPNLVLIDDAGQHHSISAEGERLYEQAHGPQPSIDQFLRATESFTTTVVFEVPDGTTHPTFLVTEGGWPTCLSPGDENSLFHTKRTTQLY